MSRDSDIIKEIAHLETLGKDRFDGTFLEEDAIALLNAELTGIFGERSRLKHDVVLLVDKFIVESSVDVRMICFEFHDTDVRYLKENLMKIFEGE